jgi:ArsR family transcriptional regulator
VENLSYCFKALSEETRLEILGLMFRYGALCGCEVEEFLDLSQSAASRHLRTLRRTGLVEDHRDNQWVYYRLAEPADDAHASLLAFLRERLATIDLPEIGDELAEMRAVRCTGTGCEAPPVAPAAVGTQTGAGTQAAAGTAEAV